ncbi:glycerol-3-phosphate dehydrogenase/oxidase [Thermicanus aegyptius]|uniref:glycerol-3-phosphate dehydrogenase/oxidase n=1 Tax=Thermicanus aegyptius TaxID=94009 RepID=UPI000419A11D|nr:glycerol-3-phosphate dehydrogenase/oxidase [Thermicanus aegyptius]
MADLKPDQGFIDQLKGEFDLLVIGGGITGAGILWDAVNRGLRAVLVEKGDFASGTSSRSTKLIHGGLRYLEQFEFGLVKEVGRERAILYRNCPHLVHPEKMLLPLIRGGKLNRLTASFGIWLYDRLAGVKRNERRRMLSREETLSLVPLLDPEKVMGGALYIEYRTDDARLTMEVIKSAVAHGALAMNYTEVIDLLYDGAGRVKGAHLLDKRTGESMALNAKAVVNATGPWVDFLRRMDHSLDDKRIHWTKGVHLVIDQKDFPLAHSIYFDTPDGRMVFAIPRDGKTYVGTTDTDYKGSLEEVRVESEDRDYLLRAIRHLFPSLSLAPSQVESGWAGIRPLIHEEGKGVSEISRKDEIFLSPSGLITIAGGKLTAFRKMAERTVDLVCAQLGMGKEKRCTPCRTEYLPLSGSEGGVERFEEKEKEMIRRGIEEFELTEKRARELFSRYGTNVGEIYALIRKLNQASDREEERLIEKNETNHPLPDSDVGKDEGISSDLLAELRYTWEKEFVYTPADFLIRRTGLLFFNRSLCREIFPFVSERLTEWNGWNERERRRWEEEMIKEFEWGDTLYA